MKNNGPRHAPIGRRAVLKGATALAGSAALGRVGLPETASAQDASTLVIACPATPQGLDIEFDVSLGSIDTLGCIYDYLVAYEKIPDPNAPEVLREDTSVRTDKPYNIALVPKLAESWRTNRRRVEGDLQAARGRQEQLGQRAHCRGREVDLGPQALSQGPGPLPDRSARPQVAGPGQDRGQIRDLFQPGETQSAAAQTAPQPGQSDL